MSFHFFGKMRLPQTVYFTISIFFIQIDPAYYVCTRTVECPKQLIQTICLMLYCIEPAGSFDGNVCTIICIISLLEPSLCFMNAVNRVCYADSP